MTDNVGNSKAKANGKPMGDTIGAVLRRARIKAGLTLEQVAQHAGVSWQYVRQIECGDRLPGTKAGRLMLQKLDLGEADIVPALGPVSLARFFNCDITAPTSFANVMRCCRQTKGLEMQELSALTGITLHHLCSLECGVVTPDEKIMHRIAEGLGKQLAEMVA